MCWISNRADYFGRFCVELRKHPKYIKGIRVSQTEDFGGYNESLPEDYNEGFFG